MTSGLLPLGVQFTDASAGYLSAWQWDFGDAAFGSANSTEQSPVHIYNLSGTYAVTLTATNCNGSSTLQKTGYITVVEPTMPVAGFTAVQVSYPDPFIVAFTGASTGFVTSWLWNFGDAGADSTMQQAIHNYGAAGMYTVTLTVANANGTSTLQKVITVTDSHATVTPSPSPSPSPGSGETPSATPSPTPLPDNGSTTAPGNTTTLPSATPVPAPDALAVLAVLALAGMGMCLVRAGKK